MLIKAYPSIMAKLGLKSNGRNQIHRGGKVNKGLPDSTSERLEEDEKFGRRGVS